jgi:hypothetical protein
MRRKRFLAGKRVIVQRRENDMTSFSRAKKPNASLEFELLLVCKGLNALSASSALF